MALAAQFWQTTVSLVDNGGNVTNRTYRNRATSQTEAETAAADLVVKLGDVSDCAIKAYSVTRVFEDSGVLFPADAGVQIENQAEVVVELAGAGQKTATMNIPAPKIGIFVASGGPGANNVDISDADFAAFLGLFQTVIGVNGYSLSDGEIVSYAIDGKRIHRKSRRG